MKKIIVLIALLGLVGCQSDGLYPRTVGQKGVAKFCVEQNRMGRFKSNDIVTVLDDTIKYRTNLQRLCPANPDVTLAYGAYITFVVADENCVVLVSEKKYIKKRNDKILIEYDIPYNPDHYFYLVYQLTI